MPLKTIQDEMPAINMTPMIDMVFLLIIFFMVGTKFSQMERRIEVRVPVVNDAVALAPAPEKRVINVYRDGQLALDQRPLGLEELVSELAAARARHADLGVIVRGDAEGSLQNVTNVLVACRRAGINELGISVRQVSRKE